MSEIFGPTIQGEGPAAGQRAVFLRLAGCNVGCTWCDTRYSWYPPEYGDRRPRRATIHDVKCGLLERSSRASDIVVITGGEPLAQSAGLIELVSILRPERPRLHLETAAVYEPLPELMEVFETIVVSPKLSNAGMNAHLRLNASAIQYFSTLGTAWFKFVVDSLEDLDEIAALESQFQIPRIMVMAEGSTTSSSLHRTRQIATEAVSRGWSLSPRLHVWLWGNTPGR